MSVGRPKKYDVSNLAIGESVLIPWNEKKGTHIGVSQKAIYVAIWREERTSGKKFVRAGRGLGVMVTRIK